jgi:uncharacterized glyoxalase superfamily protein PhnB
MTGETSVQRFSPVLRYDDADKAIRYLVETFGFTEHAVHRAPDGSVAHAELGYEGGFIGLSSRTGGDEGIFDLGPCCIYVVVDSTDIDGHHDRAVAAGADVVYPLTDQDYGSRDYAVRDSEGFVWCFGTYRPGTS